MQIILNIFNTLIPLVVALSVPMILVGFIVAIVMAFKNSNEGDVLVKRKNTRLIIWCSVGPLASLFVAISVWGLVNIISQTFGV